MQQPRLIFKLQLFLAIVFALLVSNAARSFASRLARCLAFATTAVFCALNKISCFDCFDSFHIQNSNLKIIFAVMLPFLYRLSISYAKNTVKM